MNSALGNSPWLKWSLPLRFSLPFSIFLIGFTICLAGFYYQRKISSGETDTLVHPYIELVGFLALVSLCSLAWLLFDRVWNRRMQRLLHATERLAKGETGVTAGLEGTDELAALSKAFDSMAEQIALRTTELQEANHRMAQEITARTFIEEALRNSERRFRSVWESSVDAMCLCDKKGAILAANSAFGSLVGMPVEDLLERPFTVAYREDARGALESYTSNFAQRRIPQFQRRKVTFASGKTAHLEITYSFVDLDERALLLGIFRDVTDREAAVDDLRQAKDFSENLIETATVMIIGVSVKGEITIFNQTAEQISGFRREDVLGKKLGEMLACDWPTLVQGAEARTFEAGLRTADGEDKLISWQTNPLYENGQFAGLISFGIDITEKRKQEEQRLLLERKLLDSQKLESLGVLAGGIAHDFNNLLTAILGNASLARIDLPPESRLGTYLASIEKTSLRAAELCKQMLAYSGKGRFVLQAIDLTEVVRDTVELLEISISKKAGLRLDLRDGLPTVVADPAQIRQVIMNLVINASEALGDKPGVIRVKCGVMEADTTFISKTQSPESLRSGDFVYVEISDNGSGMSEETQARIFDPFFTTKFTGRGLGLAAVLGIVRGHKGTLKLESQLGKGSKFTVLLPVTDGAPRPVLQGINEKEIWKGDGTILVADDDPNVRAVTSRMVEAFGFKVLQAVDGKHAVDVFRENHEQIRVVLLDLTMPELSGQEALQEMKRINPAVRVLMVSGYSEAGIAAELAENGSRSFLQKPFQPKELNQKLKSVFLAE